MTEPEKVANARRNIEEALMRLERDWSREMHLTCIVRHPTNPESYMVVTSDPDLRAVADTVIRSEQPATMTTPEEERDSDPR